MSEVEPTAWGEQQRLRIETDEAEAAEAAGVSVEDFRDAQRVGMEPSEFVAYRDVSSLADAERLDTELRQQAEAKAEAGREHRVEQERAKL